MRLGFIPAVAAGLCLACCGLSQGAMLNLNQHPPDIFSDFISVSYDATLQRLTASGSPATLDYDGAAPPDFDIVSDGVRSPDFEIDIKVNHSGNLTGSGLSLNDLLVTGAVDTDHDGDTGTLDNGETFDTLLTGKISKFGYQSTSPFHILEFIFNVTGGTKAADFGPQVGIILDQQSGSFNGTFTANFSNGGLGNADLFPVPEPSTLIGLAIAAFLLGAPAVARKVRKA